MISPSAVRSIIRRFGAKGTLRSLRLDYSPRSGRSADKTTVLTSFDGVEGVDMTKFAADSAMRKVDLALYASIPVVPDPGDEVVWGGKKYSLKVAEKLSPNGTTILMYTLGLVSA